MPLVRFRMYLAGRGVDVDVFLAESRYQQQLLARGSARPSTIMSPGWCPQGTWFFSSCLLTTHATWQIIGDALFTHGTLDEAYMRHWA